MVVDSEGGGGVVLKIVSWDGFSTSLFHSLVGQAVSACVERLYADIGFCELIGVKLDHFMSS